MTRARRTEPRVGTIARSRSACKELRNRAARRMGRRSVPPLPGFRSAQKRNPGRERPRLWPHDAAPGPFGVVHVLGFACRSHRTDERAIAGKFPGRRAANNLVESTRLLNTQMRALIVGWRAWTSRGTR